MTSTPAPSALPVPPTAEPAKPLRGEVPVATGLFWGVTCIAGVLAVWFLATAGEAESRFISPATLPSPGETVAKVPAVFGERRLIANTLVTLRRVCLGFGLSGLVGVPLGWWLAHTLGVNGLVWAVIVASLVSSVLLTARFVRVARRLAPQGLGMRD